MLLTNAFIDVVYFGLAVLGTAVVAWAAMLIGLAAVDAMASFSRLFRVSKGGD